MPFLVIKRTWDSLCPEKSAIVIDEEPVFEDALLLAMLYTEEHFKRIMPDRGQMIGAIFTAAGSHARDGSPIYGYQFVTNNNTYVSYEAAPKP